MAMGSPVVGTLDDVALFDKKPINEATQGTDPAWFLVILTDSY